jgi:hypothetical protein
MSVSHFKYPNSTFQLSSHQQSDFLLHYNLEPPNVVASSHTHLNLAIFIPTDLISRLRFPCGLDRADAASVEFSS